MAVFQMIPLTVTQKSSNISEHLQGSTNNPSNNGSVVVVVVVGGGGGGGSGGGGGGICNAATAWAS